MSFLTRLAALTASALLLTAPANALQPSEYGDFYAAGWMEYDEDWEEVRGPGDPFESFLYEPEFVLEHAEDIRLSDAQRNDFIDRIVDTQAEVSRMELQAAFRYGRLVDLLEADRIDAAAAMDEINFLLEVENETKRRYLGLMIHMHNALTPQQRDQLDALR